MHSTTSERGSRSKPLVTHADMLRSSVPHMRTLLRGFSTGAAKAAPWNKPFRLEKVSPMRTVPSHIVLPPYAVGNGNSTHAVTVQRLILVVSISLCFTLAFAVILLFMAGGSDATRIQGDLEDPIKSPEDIALMREACALASAARAYGGSLCKVGTTTEEIDKKVHEFIVAHNAYPSPLNYGGFPKSCCSSVNQVVVHGIPDARPLEDGDIINLDMSVFFKGWSGDCSATFLVGNVDEEGRRLVDVSCVVCLNANVSVCTGSSARVRVQRGARMLSSYTRPCCVIPPLHMYQCWILGD